MAKPDTQISVQAAKAGNFAILREFKVEVGSDEVVRQNGDIFVDFSNASWWSRFSYFIVHLFRLKWMQLIKRTTLVSRQLFYNM